MRFWGAWPHLLNRGEYMTQAGPIRNGHHARLRDGPVTQVGPLWVTGSALTGATGRRESLLSAVAEGRGCKPLTAGLWQCGKCHPRRANIKKTQPKDGQRPKPEERPQGQPGYTLVLVVVVWQSFRSPQRMMQRGPYRNCIYIAYTYPVRMTIRTEHLQNDTSLGLSSPHIPNWPVTEGPRPGSPRSY